MKIGIVLSSYYPEIAKGLLDGVKHYWENKPALLLSPVLASGAFEIPLLTKTLALKKEVAGIITLGCLIQGETTHFQWIAKSVTQSLLTLSVDQNLPIAFGILTTSSMEQALQRSSKDWENNKGFEASLALDQSIQSLKELNRLL